jgi:hypothetical protein
MESYHHILTDADIAKLGYGSKGGYDQAGLQIILLIALGITAIGILCGILVFIINKLEINRLNKNSYQ